MKTVASVALSEVSDINPRPTSRPSASELVSFLGMADIDALTGRTAVGEDRLYTTVARGYSQFTRNDLLVAKITPCFENGKIAMATINRQLGAGSTEFHVIRPDQRVLDARFLLHYLRLDRVRQQGEMRMTGSAGQRRVPAPFLAGLMVPIPPLIEQRRIGRVLDSVDLLRETRRLASTTAATLGPSLFEAMFGGSEAPVHRLAQVAHIASGITKGRKPPTAEVLTVPYLAVSNVQAGYVDLTRVKTIEASRAEIERFRLERGDLLLTEGGDPDKLGRGALWKAELERCIHQNHVFRVRVRDRDEIEPAFLSSQLAASRGRAYFLRAAKQTTGIASINKTQLGHFPVLVPPIERQREYCRSLSQADALIERQVLHLARLDALMSSLQHRAFIGTL